jgi:hypothetical protein
MEEVLLLTAIIAFGLGLTCLIAHAIRFEFRCRREARARALDEEWNRPGPIIIRREPKPAPPKEVSKEFATYRRATIDSLECRLARALQDVETERTINRTGAAPMFTMADGLALLNKQARHQWAKARLSQPWRTA